MPGTIRIEKCPNQGAAITRQTALAQNGFAVTLCVDSVNVVVATSNDDGTSTIDESLSTVTAPYIVVAARDH